MKASSIMVMVVLNMITISLCYDIKYIPDANHNATAAFAYVDGTQKEDFLLFSFDFDYHLKTKKKEIAFFKINSDFKLGEDIKYTIINKEWEK